MLTDCYEKGHTPMSGTWTMCAKCCERLILARVGDFDVWHTQAELDRLWKGVDREAAKILGGAE